MNFRKPLLFSLLMVVLVMAGFAADTTFVGTISDDMCGRKHTMMPGKSDTECVRECVKAGSSYALVTADKVYKLQGQPAQLDKLAGAKAKITGSLSGDTIKVVSVAPAK